MSRELSALLVEQVRGSDGDEVTYRDLVADDLSHLTPATALSAHPLSKTVAAVDDRRLADLSINDASFAEFLNADTIVIGVPMYNSTIPSQLKAWIERIISPKRRSGLAPMARKG